MLFQASDEKSEPVWATAEWSGLQPRQWAAEPDLHGMERVPPGRYAENSTPKLAAMRLSISAENSRVRTRPEQRGSSWRS